MTDTFFWNVTTIKKWLYNQNLGNYVQQNLKKLLNNISTLEAIRIFAPFLPFKGVHLR